jgi:glycosyltransferase involved in cell wall biosynthesis
MKTEQNINDKNQPLVSVIIPTYYSAILLEKALEKIKDQTYKNIEIIIVDNHSKDNVAQVAEKFGAKFFVQGPDQSKERVFGAPFQRNYGFKQSKGDYVYYVDADMELPQNLIKECVDIMSENKDCKALIIAEESFGEGFWAKCKWLERRTYWGDDLVEAPRFFEKETLEKMDYLDDKVGADDWDLALRLRKDGYKILRTKNYVMHNEGKLTLKKLIKKRFLYGKDVLNFGKKHGTKTFFDYFTPLRRSYLKNIFFLLSHPILFLGMIFMRICEYAGGGSGIIYSKFLKN